MELSTQEIVNLSDICRACLIKTENMKNLLDTDEDILQLITKLASISNLEIEINGSLPCFLCLECEEKLKISFDFQQLVQKSHQFILACLSATNTLKVNTVLKPLKLLSSPEKSEELRHVEHNPTDIINFISNDNLETEIQVAYKTYKTNIPIADNSTYILNEKENNTQSYFETIKSSERLSENEGYIPIDDRRYMLNEKESSTQSIYLEPVDNVSESKESAETESIKSNERLSENEDFIRPREVEKKTKNNQTMRLAQYSVEEVDRLIKKTRERFLKHVNCLYCGFTAKYSRSLSVHMTRLHRELKEQWCVWCNQSFDDLKEHLRIVHTDDFKCTLCGKCSRNTGHFLEHLASHSTERKHICKLCKKCFISARHLRTHYRVHKNDKPYSCRECSKSFIFIKSLKAHLKTHKKHRCKVCKNGFDSVKDYNVHKCISNTEVIEENDKKLELVEDVLVELKAEPQNFCEECNKKVRSLQNHKEKYHSDDNNKEKRSNGALCAYCGKQFRSLAKLTVHVRIHTGEAPYKCSYCDKRTNTRFHLVLHERTHTGEKPHICNIRGKAFAQSSVLNTHMKLHTGRPEQCSICLKRFCRGSELKQHMRKHTGEKPYLCSYCNQGFTQKSHLVEHGKTHSNERPYQCEFCEKSFKQAGTLKSHINIHLGKKPYKCSQCPYACRQSYSLTQHMAQHENDEPKPERPHKCGLCDRSFTTLAMFSSHYINKHAPVDDGHIISGNFAGAIKIDGEGVVGNLDQFTQ